MQLCAGIVLAISIELKKCDSESMGLLSHLYEETMESLGIVE